MSDDIHGLNDQAKQVIEAAKEASKSTRTTIYFILIALFTLSMIYSTADYPDWITIRIERYEKAAFCWKDKKSDDSGVCYRAVKYTLRHIWPKYADLERKQDDAYLRIFVPNDEYMNSVFDNIKLMIRSNQERLSDIEQIG